MSNNNFLNQLRQRGIKVSLEGSKIKLFPTEHLTEKVQCWLVKYKDSLLVLIRKEQQQLKKLIENVGRHDNWTNEEIEEMFDYAINQISLDVAISSYQVTALRQARVVSISYNKTVFCKACQKHILLGKESPYEVPHCPYCERNKESTNA
ncbi:hypothetical protein [Rickettsiella endosymbiont of Dermanyssus gallinae]|uniref:hypothetical protein n=1 Tax=Rickettsiella endosymbiont of Dermanyssus gallinae TaxID=2856608 RepID=UPI001C532EA1|nr:hypothetical protein [Rickettsiella endosymbiont of Dermanyssus gallinae]